MHHFCLKVAILSIGCFVSGASPSMAQMPSGTAPPGLGKIEFENDAIAVVRIHMDPRAKTPMHDIPTSRLVIWLTDAHLKDTSADGRVSEYDRPAGSIDWIEPRRHMGENLSDHGLDFLAVIPKTAAASGAHHGPVH
jgi:hypothetical protein